MLLRVLSVSGWSGAEHPRLVGQQLPEQPQRLARLAGLPGPGGDVVAGCERVGMVRAEHPRLVGQQLLEQPQRLAIVAALTGETGQPCT